MCRAVPITWRALPLPAVTWPSPAEEAQPASATTRTPAPARTRTRCEVMGSPPVDAFCPEVPDKAADLFANCDIGIDDAPHRRERSTQPAIGAIPMGEKQQPPKLPKGAPKDLSDFVACTSATLTWKAGKIDWLKLKDLLPKDFPGKDWVPEDAKPEISFEDDGKGGVNLGIGVGGLTLLTLPASIKGGKLTIDTSGVPDVGGARDKI